jgi:AraC-like DNA-binding protein
MARPKKQIDPEEVRKLAAIQCSYAEMADILGCNESTLTRRFAQVIKVGRSHAFASLKRKQYEVAMTGNVGMLIWLGKQYLEQTDKREIDTTIHGGITIEQKQRYAEELKAKILELAPAINEDDL